MNGHILPGTEIAVDYWKIKGRQEMFVHFLTHLHGDHIVGLTSTWTRHIYCSEITALLLEKHHGLSRHLLKVLPLKENVVIQSKSGPFTVMAFDANHCPGAVMFYFKGNFGSILYTGDFRSSGELITDCLPVARNADVLYLDNTFCDKKCIFPPRSECLAQILDIVRRHPKQKIIVGVHKLGKEVLLGELGAQLNETIVVSPRCYKFCCELFDTNVFTTPHCIKKSRIWAVPMNQINIKSIKELKCMDKETIVIIPTAIFTGIQIKPYTSVPGVYVVPYSDHSSYPELYEFVSALSPKCIKPIVLWREDLFGNSVCDRADMSCFHELLSSSQSSSTNNPISEQQSSSILTNQLVDFDTITDITVADQASISSKTVFQQDKCNSSKSTNDISSISVSEREAETKLASYLSPLLTDRECIQSKKMKLRPKRVKVKPKGVVFDEEDVVDDSECDSKFVLKFPSPVQHSLPNSQCSAGNSNFLENILDETEVCLRKALEREKVRISQSSKVKTRQSFISDTFFPSGDQTPSTHKTYLNSDSKNSQMSVEKKENPNDVIILIDSDDSDNESHSPVCKDIDNGTYGGSNNPILDIKSCDVTDSDNLCNIVSMPNSFKSGIKFTEHELKLETDNSGDVIKKGKKKFFDPVAEKGLYQNQQNIQNLKKSPRNSLYHAKNHKRGMGIKSSNHSRATEIRIAIEGARIIPGKVKNEKEPCKKRDIYEHIGHVIENNSILELCVSDAEENSGVCSIQQDLEKCNNFRRNRPTAMIDDDSHYISVSGDGGVSLTISINKMVEEAVPNIQVELQNKDFGNQIAKKNHSHSHIDNSENIGDRRTESQVDSHTELSLQVSENNDVDNTSNHNVPSAVNLPVHDLHSHNLDYQISCPEGENEPSSAFEISSHQRAEIISYANYLKRTDNHCICQSNHKPVNSVIEQHFSSSTVPIESKDSKCLISPGRQGFVNALHGFLSKGSSKKRKLPQPAFFDYH
ncbi:desumoylating isopeptidase 2-like [Plakobranchus ocellatus]|uniref:5' exonuclease Apollo n=1 Tax=Plakobranchus ocellatus TaxID=259542 RepID=A0AAV3YK08_9GAST|nr:desumoylating isopeptidase 2-like [Plakobranchus ocellatus]